LITSYARVHSAGERPSGSVDTEMSGLSVRVSASGHAKCVRCWHHRADVGTHPEHPLLCGRCVENLGRGESREFA
jgi:isoleucyl-tRNA synthetase